MKVFAVALAACACSAGITDARAGNGTVIALDEVTPGVYGRVQVSDVPPLLVYPKPIRVVRTRRHLKPIYLHVPPVHAKRWGRYCYKYRACHMPVYFVKSTEYGPSRREGDGETYAEVRR